MTKADNETQQLGDEVKALRARVEELESREASKEESLLKCDDQDSEIGNEPLGMDYFETPKGRVILFIVAVFISVVIIRVLGL